MILMLGVKECAGYHSQENSDNNDHSVSKFIDNYEPEIKFFY